MEEVGGEVLLPQQHDNNDDVHVFFISRKMKPAAIRGAMRVTDLQGRGHLTYFVQLWYSSRFKVCFVNNILGEMAKLFVFFS